MNENDFIASGIIELYVSGTATPAESELVEQMAVTHPEVRAEINAISKAFELHAQAHAITPSPLVRVFLMAVIDYTERLKNGEAPTIAPLLNPNSTPADFQSWLGRPDMVPTGNDDLFAKIISFTPEATTAIVWIKEFAPQEIHHNEHERFLVLEGSCELRIGDDVRPLGPADYFEIPLHMHHTVKVTSALPCKVILQRVAA
ncbi:MAG: cupin domain-containing protein [Ferruginibacter sp.]